MRRFGKKSIRLLCSLPLDTCMLLDPFCLSSSELEDVVLDDDWHFLFMVTGTLQLSKYLEITKMDKLLHFSSTSSVQGRQFLTDKIHKSGIIVFVFGNTTFEKHFMFVRSFTTL